MSTGKGRRLGGPATISTLTEPTEPEIVQPRAQRAAAEPAPAPEEAGQSLVLTTDAAPAVSAAPAVDGPAVDVEVPMPPARADRPRAEDLVRRRTGDVQREQINAMTPAALQLTRRMGYFKLDQGIELRDQVALAVDAWLRGQGY